MCGVSLGLFLFGMMDFSIFACCFGSFFVFSIFSVKGFFFSKYQTVLLFYSFKPIFFKIYTKGMTIRNESVQAAGPRVAKGNENNEAIGSGKI